MMKFLRSVDLKYILKMGQSHIEDSNAVGSYSDACMIVFDNRACVISPHNVLSALALLVQKRPRVRFMLWTAI